MTKDTQAALCQCNRINIGLVKDNEFKTGKPGGGGGGGVPNSLRIAKPIYYI